MEVFYIPNHKVILKKRKKKRKFVETQVLKITTTLPANPLEVIKEGTSTTPMRNLKNWPNVQELMLLLVWTKQQKLGNL